MLIELLLFLILGAAIGSFLTVVVERYDTLESAWIGRSHCNHCKEVLRWWELVPLMGYMLVKGQCPKCQKHIPRIYPLFEAITSATFVAIRLAAGTQPNYYIVMLELIVVCALLILCFYDWLSQTFPVSMLAIAGGIILTRGLLLAFLAPYAPSVSITEPAFSWLNEPRVLLASLAVGGLLGGGLLGLLAFPSKGKWMGYGDVVLMFLLGLWLGYPKTLTAILFAFYAGAFIGGALLISRKINNDHRIAFGPFLILSAIIVHVWGNAWLQRLLMYWGAQ